MACCLLYVKFGETSNRHRLSHHNQFVPLHLSTTGSAGHMCTRIARVLKSHGSYPRCAETSAIQVHCIVTWKMSRSRQFSCRQDIEISLLKMAPCLNTSPEGISNDSIPPRILVHPSPILSIYVHSAVS